MTTTAKEMELRVSRAMRLDADMRKALRNRLQTISEQEAEEAISKIEATRLRSLELRKEAERRRDERVRSDIAQQRLSDDLLEETRNVVKEVLQATAARLEAGGVAAEIAGPIVHASVDNWTESIRRTVDDFRTIPSPTCFVADMEIGPVDALDGLTKVEAYCSASGHFDAVVGVNAGGDLFGKYLAHRLNIGVEHRVDTEGSKVIFRDRISPKHRVLVVDDFARSGRTANAVWQALDLAGVVQASYVTLVSSMACRAAIANIPLYSPVVSARTDALLPWKTKSGELTVDGDSYVFGPSSDRNAFSVHRRQAEFIVRQLLEKSFFHR